MTCTHHETNKSADSTPLVRTMPDNIEYTTEQLEWLGQDGTENERCSETSHSSEDDTVARSGGPSYSWAASHSSAL